MASADKCHHTMSFLQYVPDQKPGLSTRTLLVLPAYRAIMSWAHFSHCRARQTPLKLPVPGELDLGALKEHGEGEEKERWGILGNSSKEKYRQEHPAVFSSDVTQAECSPLKWLHSAVQ